MNVMRSSGSSHTVYVSSNWSTIKQPVAAALRVRVAADARRA